MIGFFGLGFFVCLLCFVGLVCLILFLVPLHSLNGISCLPQTSTSGGCAVPQLESKKCMCMSFMVYRYSRNRFQLHSELFFLCFYFSLCWSLSVNQYKCWDENHAATSECLSCTKPFRGIIQPACGYNCPYLWEKHTIHAEAPLKKIHIGSATPKLQNSSDVKGEILPSESLVLLEMTYSLLKI